MKLMNLFKRLFEIRMTEQRIAECVAEQLEAQAIAEKYSEYIYMLAIYSTEQREEESLVGLEVMAKDGYDWNWHKQ
jgi:hypothetical protein